MEEQELPERYWSTEEQRWIYPGDLPPMPTPDVKAGEYAGPPGEGASENYFSADTMQTYARAAALAERERCAKACEDMEALAGATVHDIARAIRKG